MIDGKEEIIRLYANFTEEVFQRTLKPSELKQLVVWAENKVKLHTITRAYGLMMKNCEKPSFSYMAKILENWHFKDN